MSFTKLNPTSSMYLGGFDGRGCTASLNNASDSGFTVSGIFSDQADFVVLTLFNADDNFGHLTTSKYLPDFSLRGVILDFDLITKGCFNPTSPKYESVPWKTLSYILADGSSNTVAFPTPSVNYGGAEASIKFTLTGTPTTYDRLQIIYLSNLAIDSANFGITTGQTLAQVAAAMVALVGSASYGGAVPLTAEVDPLDATSFYIYYPIGIDGNKVGLVTSYSGNTIINNTGHQYLTGGVDPDSIHLTFDFTALGIDNVRQIWFTIAPVLPVGTAATFTQLEFIWQAVNWTVTDPNSQTQLFIGGPLSSIVPSLNGVYTGTWTVESGFYYHGFSKAASSNAATVTLKYTNANVHDLYLGTVLGSGNGTFDISINSVSYGSIDTALSVDTPIVTRRQIATNLPGGSYTVVLTTTSTANTYFDYLHAVVPTVPSLPVQTYDNLSAALDFDTNQTYSLSPERAINVLRYLGLRGNIDVYAGVFFKEVRTRNGGKFNSATVTFSGAWDTGTGFGDGSQLFIVVSGTTMGVSVFVSDTQLTIAQRFADFVNTLFVGCGATVTGDSSTAAVVITQLSPLNYFTVTVSTTDPASGTAVLTGNLDAGNEGTWEVATVNSNLVASFPLNKAFIDWLNDFSTTAALYGLPFTLAFSQEILQPPDVNTADGAWTQRYNDGTPALTATGFGSWGVGYITSYSVAGGTTTIVLTGHGYTTGNTCEIWSVSTPFSPPGVSLLYTGLVTVIDANTFSIHATPTIADGDQVFVNLLTSQATFNPNTVTPYIASQYLQASAYCDTMQFGEILWWFFSGGTGPSMAYYDAYTSSIATAVLGRSLATFSGPTSNPNVNSYADAALLRSLLVAHIHAIRTTVLAGTIRGILFEWLLPLDVNWPVNYTNVQYPYNIGGAMNRYVNVPQRYLYGPGDDIDLIKMEGLAWGTSYRTLDNALSTMSFPSADGAWPLSLTSYLIPADNGGCPWVQELNLAISNGIGNMCFWAIDHLVLLSWDFPMPFIPIVKSRNPFFTPLTTAYSYLRNFINDLISTVPPNNGGAQGGLQ